MKSYKILGFIVGAHSCGACYVVDGKIIANIEEERLTRIKGHVDFENDFERYPVRSIEHLIQRYGMDLSQIDYFTSFLPKELGIDVFRAMYNFNIISLFLSSKDAIYIYISSHQKKLSHATFHFKGARNNNNKFILHVTVICRLYINNTVINQVLQCLICILFLSVFLSPLYRIL